MNEESFWDRTHPLSEESTRIFNQYVPPSGATKYVETELYRAATRLMYDWYNNGWEMNNKTPELEFLQSKDYFERVSVEDLALGDGLRHEEYMDEELSEIIQLVLFHEKENSLTPLKSDPLSELGLSMQEWYALTEDEDEDEEDGWDDDEE